MTRVIFFIIISILGGNCINITEAKSISAYNPVKNYVNESWPVYVAMTVGIGTVYYMSRYPRGLGSILTLSSIIGMDPEHPKSSLLLMSPSVFYDFFLTKVDVGPEGRTKVFLTNAGLMISGHYTYKWFFKKESSEPNYPLGVTVTPVVFHDYQGAVITKWF